MNHFMLVKPSNHPSQGFLSRSQQIATSELPQKLKLDRLGYIVILTKLEREIHIQGSKTLISRSNLGCGWNWPQ